MPDARLFKLPDVGEGLTEAEIVTWKVRVGDTVKVNQVIVEIETAKSLVELPSPYAGTVEQLLADEGDTVNVGTPIIAVGTGAGAEGGAGPAPGSTGAGEAGDSGTAVAADEAPVSTPGGDQAVEPGLIGGPAPGGRTSVLVGYGPRTTEAKRRPRKNGAKPVDEAPAASQEGVQQAFTPQPTADPEVSVEDAPDAGVPSHDVSGDGGTGAADGSTGTGRAAPDGGSSGDGHAAKVRAKPPVRKLARDLGVDLATVTATGPNGSITRADVESSTAAARTPQTAPDAEPAVPQPTAPDVAAAASLPGVQGETRVPIKGVRKMTAQAMVSSAFTAPHVTEWMTVDATRTMRTVQRLRGHRDFRDVKVSPLLLVARAACLAMRRTPELNASWDEATQEIVFKSQVNLGIAAATPRGLVVPNVKNADAMSAAGLAKALGELTSTARAGKTQPADMAGGTFTITNVGVFGVDAGTPILNPGEAGILCMGAIRKQPWVVRNKIRPRWITTLALSFDHRIVDGEQGSRFLADVAGIVEDPSSALLL